MNTNNVEINSIFFDLFKKKQSIGEMFYSIRQNWMLTYFNVHSKNSHV